MVMLRDVMTRHFEATHPEATVKDAVTRMNSLNLTMLPVCEDRRLLGILAEPELGERLSALQESPAAAKVRDIMTADVLTGREDQELRDVIALMRDRDISILPVLDFERRVLGVFCLGGPWRRRRI